MGKRRASTRAASKGGFRVPKLPKPKERTWGAATQRAAVGGARCGAKKRSGSGRCNYAAGWGTNHPGTGRCKLHGGSTPSQIKSAAKEEYRTLFGQPMEINPLDALIWCIKMTAGEIEWLSNRMAELDEEDWVESTIAGKQFHLYARERSKRQQDLARFSQMAISLGIAERAVKLAEMYGETIARLIQGILGDLELSEQQRAKVPNVVRRHLIALEGGAAEPPALPSGEAA